MTMKWLRGVSTRLFLIILGLLGLLAGAAGAANVEPGIGYTNAFGTLPPAEEWATGSIAGSAQDTYDMDADVNANTSADGVTAQTTSDPGNPAAATANAAWSSTGFYVQTRPTGNRYTVLMGKFLNNSGTNATQVTVSYLSTIAGGGVAEETGRGTRVYYSLS